MKKLLFTLALLLCATFVFSQDTEPDKGSGVCYFSDYPATTPSASTSECEFAINTAVPEAWVYSRPRSEWIPLNNFNFGFGAPSGSPESNGFNGLLYVDRSSGKIYQWTTDWNLIAGTNIQKYPNSSPALLVNGDSLSLDLSLLSPTDVEALTSRVVANPAAMVQLTKALEFDSLRQAQTESIAEAIANDSAAIAKLKDSTGLKVIVGDSQFVAKSLEFTSSQTVLKQYLTNDGDGNLLLVTNLSLYNLDPAQIDSLVQRIVQEQTAIDKLNETIKPQGVDSLGGVMQTLIDTMYAVNDSTLKIVQLGGNEYEVKILGRAPVQQGTVGGANGGGITNILFTATTGEKLVNASDTSFNFQTNNANVFDVAIVGNSLFVNLKGGQEGQYLGYVNGAYVWADPMTGGLSTDTIAPVDPPAAGESKFWFDEGNATLYQFRNGAWVENELTGSGGNATGISSGSGAPTNSPTGTDPVFYVDNASGDIYQYQNGAWVKNDPQGGGSTTIIKIPSSSPALYVNEDSVGLDISKLTAAELETLAESIATNPNALQNLLDNLTVGQVETIVEKMTEGTNNPALLVLADSLKAQGFLESKFDTLYAVNDTTIRVVTTNGQYNVVLRGLGVGGTFAFTSGQPTNTPTGTDPKIAIDNDTGKIWQWNGTAWEENLASGGGSTGGDGVTTGGALNTSMKKIDYTVNGASGFSVDLDNIESIIDALPYSAITGAPTIPQTLDDLAAGANTSVFSKADSTKLANIDQSGEANVQADWNVTDTNDDAFIKGKPTLFSGSYNDLTDAPSLFDGSYSSLTGTPSIFPTNWANVANKPTFFSGSYNDLTDKPTSFPTAWGDITGIPADILNGDDNTTYSAGAGITLTGTTFSLTDASTQASVNNSGRTVIQDITLDAYGRVTGLGSTTLTDANTTYSAGAGITLSGTTFSLTDPSSQASVNNSGDTYIQDITLDAYGRVTGITSNTITASSGGFTYYEKIDITATGTSVTATEAIPTDKSQVRILRDGIEVTNYTLSNANKTLTFPISFYPPETIEIYK